MDKTVKKIIWLLIVEIIILSWDFYAMYDNYQLKEYKKSILMGVCAGVIIGFLFFLIREQILTYKQNKKFDEYIQKLEEERKKHEY